MLEMVLMQVALLGMLDSLMNMVVGLIGWIWDMICLCGFYIPCEFLVQWPLSCIQWSCGVGKWCLDCGSSILNMCFELCMSCVEPCLRCIPF